MTSVFPNHKKGRPAELWIIPTGILIDLKKNKKQKRTDQSLVFNLLRGG